MDLWTKHFHDMPRGKLDTIHKSVHNAPQPASQVGGSQVRVSKRQGKMNLESDPVYSEKLAIFSTPLADVRV